jgi:hypothetical protein
MNHRRIALITLTLLLIAGRYPVWAQFPLPVLPVTDPATTARNAITARLTDQMLQALTMERDRLRRMAARLSALTSLRKYALNDLPKWRTHDFESDAFLYSLGYHAALNYGDPAGHEYIRVARARQAVHPAVLSGQNQRARDVLIRALSTIDVADSAIIAGTHQTGTLRFNGRRELAAIDALERHVVDPSDEQSTTAILDKISGAVLIETRNKQARIQLLAALAEQLLVENKRSRDAETAAMNMQLGRLREGRAANTALLSRASDDFRGWRQP